MTDLFGPIPPPTPHFNLRKERPGLTV